MRRLALAALLLLGACTLPPPPDTAVVAGNINTQTPILEPAHALDFAAWALAVPLRTRNNAISGSYAMAALDYLAGEVATGARFTGINQAAVQQLLAGRRQARRVLGIAPGATSTQVVGDLLATYQALARHDIAAARAALPAQVFTLGPDRTIRLLANLPPLPLAASALAAIAAQYDGPGAACPLCL